MAGLRCAEMLRREPVSSVRAAQRTEGCREMSRKRWLGFGLFNMMLGVVAYLVDHGAGVWSFGLMGATIALVAPLPVSNQFLRWMGVVIMGIGILSLPVILSLAVAFQTEVPLVGFLVILWVLFVGFSIMLVGFPGKTVSEASAEPTDP